MSDCCIVVWYDSLKNAIIIEKKSESNSLLFLFVVSIRLLLWSGGRGLPAEECVRYLMDSIVMLSSETKRKYFTRN